MIDDGLWKPDGVADGDRWTGKYCERCQMHRTVGGCSILATLVTGGHHEQVRATPEGWGRCMNFSHVIGNNYP